MGSRSPQELDACTLAVGRDQRRAYALTRLKRLIHLNVALLEAQVQVQVPGVACVRG
jgi:hypothetical protein